VGLGVVDDICGCVRAYYWLNGGIFELYVGLVIFWTGFGWALDGPPICFARFSRSSMAIYGFPYIDFSPWSP